MKGVRGGGFGFRRGVGIGVRRGRGEGAKQKCKITNKMDGWRTCHFTSFSTVFQPYWDDGRLIMKGCVQWHSVYD